VSNPNQRVSECILATRRNHSPTLLTDGRDIVVGDDGVAIALLLDRKDVNATDPTGVLYAPIYRSFAATDQPVIVRVHHSATVSADGRVIVAGGERLFLLLRSLTLCPSA